MKFPPAGLGIVQIPAVEVVGVVDVFTTGGGGLGVPPLELLEPLLLPDDEDDPPDEELLDDELPLDEVELPELLPDDEDPLAPPLLVLEPDDEVEDDEEPPEELELDEPLLDELEPDELLLDELPETLTASNSAMSVVPFAKVMEEPPISWLGVTVLLSVINPVAVCPFSIASAPWQLLYVALVAYAL
jgi:hypothetical protein